MTDSPDEQKGKRTNVERFGKSSKETVQWMANHFVGWIITSLLGGAGAAYVLTETDLLEVESGIKLEIQDAEKRIGERLDFLRSRQDALDSKVTVGHQNIQSKVVDVANQLNHNGTEVRNSFGAAEQTRNSLAASIFANRQKVSDVLNFIDKDLNSISVQIAETDLDISNNHKIVMAKVEALFDQFQLYQQAFIDQMDELAGDGKQMINGNTITGREQMAKIEMWLVKANYMIRSLVIPTEAGLLKDTSVAKKDIRKAMEGFASEQDDNARMEHARRALVIVEAIRDLAEGGRIPQASHERP